ncbi:hypothetical protein BP6252_00421 [Coleophoma cylindrospora]|uniref:Short-chain dehydrogenase/oxidoreductase n=1 Tax=Coleophoma cylindrospora TaxID=1849047 RepID=A0A3D8SPY8_9HELO|nr:hypothetical protein BP6252_00421 [Coleophoma cylindrospora]
MAFQYRKVLLIGATSGIGEALAEKLVADGTFVIVVGRRKEKLDSFVNKHGEGKAAAVELDITKLDRIPPAVSTITSSHPDIDCIFLNSGIQRPFDFTRPETINLDDLEQELTTNYLSFVHLTRYLLPILQKQSRQTSIVYTSSQLGIVPMVRAPNYGASKAALHHFVLALREQMKDGPGNVNVVEIFPPAVQTELHDAKHQPDLKNGHQIGIPLQEFIDSTWTGLVKGDEQIAVGPAKDIFDAVEPTRQRIFRDLHAQLTKVLQDFLV